MKNVFFALAIAAVAVSCTSTSEEAVVENTTDSTITAETVDSLEDAAYPAEGEEASAE
jgi:hypothetical protein